ncbi:SulP family inorganic anion transporter [Oxalobacteraceae bacterium]|nr:SulP family inorganic anion transporter [Oxalobacteraceae bacterium]
MSGSGTQPAWRWPARLGDRRDWRAGAISALIMMPQAIILATLAGLPAEAGIYAAVFPVALAALLGRCPTLLSGPNTTLCLMISSALTPLASPHSADYLQLALMLSALVGALQLIAAMLGLGRLFVLLPAVIARGLALGVGAVIIASQTNAMLGLLGVEGESAWVALWRLPGELGRANGYALAVAAVTVLSGVLCGAGKGRGWLRWCSPHTAALLCGTAAACALSTLLGAAYVDLERVGGIALTALPWSLPQFHGEDLYLSKQLLQSAFMIAFMGATQTLIIVRNGQGEVGGGAANVELCAQGLANLLSSLTSGFAGSGSFNRSAAHASAGARTRLAGVLSALFMYGFGFVLAPLIAVIPLAALAGTLALIGADLLRSTLRGPPGEGRRARLAMLGVGLLVLFAGLETALFASLAAYGAVRLWRAATPPRTAPPETAVPLAPQGPASLRSRQHRPAPPASGPMPLERTAGGGRQHARHS